MRTSTHCIHITILGAIRWLGQKEAVGCAHSYIGDFLPPPCPASPKVFCLFSWFLLNSKERPFRNVPAVLLGLKNNQRHPLDPPHNRYTYSV